jgi:hypothetical protein
MTNGQTNRVQKAKLDRATPPNFGDCVQTQTQVTVSCVPCRQYSESRGRTARSPSETRRDPSASAKYDVSHHEHTLYQDQEDPGRGKRPTVLPLAAGLVSRLYFRCPCSIQSLNGRGGSHVEAYYTTTRPVDLLMSLRK